MSDGASGITSLHIRCFYIQACCSAVQYCILKLKPHIIGNTQCLIQHRCHPGHGCLAKKTTSIFFGLDRHFFGGCDFVWMILRVIFQSCFCKHTLEVLGSCLFCICQFLRIRNLNSSGIANQTTGMFS